MVYRHAALAALSYVLLGGSVFAQPADKFFEKKTISVIVGSAAGGGYDSQARLLARHLGKHIPGSPQLVVQNMPGAGGLVASNTLYNVAPKDGTSMALLQRTALTAKALIGDNVNFDVEKMAWVGSLAGEPGVLMVWHTSPVKTAEDLFKRELVVGGAGAGNDSELTSKVINALLGTKLKIVSGYQSATQITLAMERGEVEAIPDWSWSNAKTLKPQYLRDKLANVVMQFGPTRLKELGDVPTPLEFAKSEEDRQLLALYFAPKAVSRPVALPPGVPADRVALIRSAFMAMTKDPEFLADAEKSGIPADPADHTEIEKVVQIVAKAPPESVKKLRAIIGAN